MNWCGWFCVLAWCSGSSIVKKNIVNSVNIDIYLHPVSISLLCFCSMIHVIFFTIREAAWCIISVMSVCLSVCLTVCLSVCETITFECFSVGSSYLHIRYLSREYGSGSYMKVIRWRSRSQEQKGKKSLFLQSSFISNSCSIKQRAIKFACSV